MLLTNEDVCGNSQLALARAFGRLSPVENLNPITSISKLTPKPSLPLSNVKGLNKL